MTNETEMCRLFLNAPEIEKTVKYNAARRKATRQDLERAGTEQPRGEAFEGRDVGQRRARKQAEVRAGGSEVGSSKASGGQGIERGGHRRGRRPHEN